MNCCENPRIEVEEQSGHHVCIVCGQVAGQVLQDHVEFAPPAMTNNRPEKSSNLFKVSRNKFKEYTEGVVAQLKIPKHIEESTWQHFMELKQKTNTNRYKESWAAVLYLSVRAQGISIPLALILKICNVDRSKFYSRLDVARMLLHLVVKDTQSPLFFIPQLISQLQTSDLFFPIDDFDASQSQNIQDLSFQIYYLIMDDFTSCLPTTVAVACLGCAFEAWTGSMLDQRLLNSFCKTLSCSSSAVRSKMGDVCKIIASTASDMGYSGVGGRRRKAVYRSLFEMMEWITAATLDDESSLKTHVHVARPNDGEVDDEIDEDFSR